MTGTAADHVALSPIEERHIDYILEEEFTVNPEFLDFFVAEATLQAVEPGRVVTSCNGTSCAAVRSATTDKGETDLLVTYGAEQDTLPVAILIEDKIRAGFQPEQAKRYRLRGEEGKGTKWAKFWTCLVAHKDYASATGDFDAVVSLQSLLRYFESKPDARSRFRARLLSDTIHKYERNGVQRVDEVVTRYRSMYSSECALGLDPAKWTFDKPRIAWRDDTWFYFKAASWPKGVKAVHQTRSGLVKLVLPFADQTFLRSVVGSNIAGHPGSPRFDISVTATGKTKSSLQVAVPRVTDFSNALDLSQVFAALDLLDGTYVQISASLPAHLRPVTKASKDECSSPEDINLRALQAVLLGFLRSVTLRLGTDMPFPLPDVRKLSTTVQEKDRYFPSAGLMGGFLLELVHEPNGEPVLLSEYWSRQWGAHTIHHRMTSSEIRQLPENE